mgnify:FL=1
MKKLLPVFVLALIVPQIAFAAWWNPLSWFESQSVSPEIQTVEETVGGIESEITATDTSPQSSSPTQPTQDSDQYISSLISQIVLLNKENTELRFKLDSCQIPVTTGNMNSAIKIINTTELDKQNKLKKLIRRFSLLLTISMMLDQYLKRDVASYWKELINTNLVQVT